MDDNHGDIVKALRRVGAFVQSIAAVGDGTPDLLVGYRRQTFLLEVKDPAKKPSAQALTLAQVVWHRGWRGLPVLIVHTPEEAMRAIGAVRVQQLEDEG